MARVEEADHIGYDPVAWVERLREVAAGSKFHPDDKATIDQSLNTLRMQLTVREGCRGLQSKAG